MYILGLNIWRSSVAEAILDIKHWGNNLGVRLPAAVAREANLHADQRVRVTVEAGRVVIEPIRDEPLTLEQRLARFDPALHGGESMATEAVGAEKW
jgi:antitoxin MazE